MIKRKDLFMGTTEVEATKTISLIQEHLAKMGANQIATQYDENREPAAVYFTLKVGGNIVPFQLPARIDPIYKILRQGRDYRSIEADKAQAKRVAWRQIYRWIQAQTALIETGMVVAEEVLMPYIQVAPNETLYQRAVSGGFAKLLTAGNAEVQR